jgi:glutathione peroxidase-family protein
MADEQDRLEHLEEIARERWGERWTITQKHFADGTTKATAWRTYGPVDIDTDGQVFEIERIRIKDGEALHEHVYQRDGTVIERFSSEITDVDEISDLDSLNGSSER